MGMSPSGKSRVTMSEINVTPLVDVMLVLLIIFMVTTPLMQQGIDIDLPETSSSGRDIKDDPFVLIIKNNRKVYIGEAAIPMDQLKIKLANIFAHRKDKQLYLQADRKVEYGFVAEAMGEIRAAGIHNIGLVTVPKSGL